MQAAMSPIALDEEVLMLQLSKLKSLKTYFVKKVSQAMLDNIAKGKLARFFKDNTLVNQDYIKDNKLALLLH
jgi:elongation factor Ts